MIQECLHIFEKYIETYSESYVWENYTPKDGTYLLIEMNNGTFQPKEPFDILYNKKEDRIEGETHIHYSYIQQLDYYSNLLGTNKAIDKKKIIHSNNYMTFFVKKESIISKLKDDIIDSYYDVLKEPSIKYGNSTSLYTDLEKEIGKPDVSCIEQVHSWIKTYFANLSMDTGKKDYLKLFFILPDQKETIRLYNKESKRYIIPNIYNDNKANRNVDKKLYGVPNNNMNMNSKKPYLMNRSRKVQQPYLVSLEQAQLQGKFFDYLTGKVHTGYVNLYAEPLKKRFQFLKEGEFPNNFSDGYFLRLQKGKETEIHNFEVIVGYNYNLIHSFVYKNIINTDVKNGPEYGLITTLKDLQMLVDDIYFSKYLKNNYFTKPEDISVRDGVIKYNLLKARDRLFTWFYKGSSVDVPSMLNHVSLELIKHTLSNSYYHMARQQLNLRWSFMDYFSESTEMEEHMLQVRKSLRKHINSEDEWEFETHEEYCYAVGQLISYYVSLLKGKNVAHSLINPFLNVKKDDVMKNKLNSLYMKVNYNISMNNKRVNRLIDHVVICKPVEPIERDYLLAGFASDSLIYEKKEEEN